MNMIVLPSRKVLMPHFEIPRFLRNLKDDTLARMMQQRTSGKNVQVGNRGILLSQGGAGANPLATVPWVAQWKFNNNGNDSIGANNLTNNNSATFTTGKLGGATGATQLVRASSQYWSIVDNAALSTGDVDFSVLAWVYLDSKPAAEYMYAVSRSSGTLVEYNLFYSTGTDRLIFEIWNAGLTISNSVSANNFGSPSLATWYCVMAWHDSVANTVNISVNDGTVNTAATTIAPGDLAVSTVIGRYNITSSRYWDGRVDNVCIAKSAAGSGGVLSAAQRTLFYNAGVGTETLT